MSLDVGPISAQSPALAPILAGIAMGAAGRERDGLSASGAFDLIRRCRLGALRLTGDADLRDLMSVVIGLGNADPAIALVMVDHFRFVERCLRRCRTAGGATSREAALNGALFHLIDFRTDDGGAARPDLHAVPTPDGRFYRLAGFAAASMVRSTDFIAVGVHLPDRSRAWAIVPHLHAEDSRNGLFVPTQDLVPADDTSLGEACSGPVLHQLMLAAVSVGISRAIRRDATYAALVQGSAASGRLPHKAAAAIVGEIAADAAAGEATVLAAAEALDRLEASLPAGTLGPSAILTAALHAEEARSAVDRLTRRSARRLFDLCEMAGDLSDLDPERHERHAGAVSLRASAHGSAGGIGALGRLEPLRSVLLSTL